MTTRDSWPHRIARFFVRPLVGTPVTPNHLTTLRLLTGLAACAAIAVGDRSWEIAGGVLWVVSALLDCADGELARLTGASSRFGHQYDFWVDVFVLAAFFIGAGIGQIDSFLGYWAVPMGIVAGVSAGACTVMAEHLAQRDGHDKPVYASRFGFDFDDILSLFAVIVWLGWLLPFLTAAAVGAPIFALLTLYLVRGKLRAKRKAA